MFARIEGELLKVVRVENGWVVYVWDPEVPTPLPAQGGAPCSQQPVKWWRAYVFEERAQVGVFIAGLLEKHPDA